MNERDITPQLAEEVLGVPYALGAYQGETPQFVADTIPAPLPQALHKIHDSMQWLLFQYVRGVSLEEIEGPGLPLMAARWRAMLMDEKPTALRGCVRRLMRYHNQGRVHSKRGMSQRRALAMFRFVPLASILDSIDMEPQRTAEYLEVTGYISQAALSEEASQVAVPHDAHAFLALYPPVLLAGEDERTCGGLATELHRASGDVLDLAYGMRPVVRQSPQKTYIEYAYYTAEQVAAIRRAAQWGRY